MSDFRYFMEDEDEIYPLEAGRNLVTDEPGSQLTQLLRHS
jgi:hypothetical protein